MVKDTIGILKLPQRDFNRQIHRLILEVKSDNTALAARVEVLEDALGEYEDEDTISERLTALETPSTEPGG